MSRWSVGDRVWFEEEKRPYRVRAVSASGRFAACTKPFVVYGPTAVIYTMVDLVEGMRGVDNTIGNSLGYETRAQCKRAVALFEGGELEFSGRSRPILLKVKRHEPDDEAHPVPEGPT